MKKFMSRKFVVLLMLIGMLVMATAVVHAITITVDGDREAAWTAGSGGQTPGSHGDANEPGINDNVDIQTFRWTNDQTNFYFAIEVWGPPPLMTHLVPINICLDTDNSAATDMHPAHAIYRDRCSYGTGVTGIDTVVEVVMLGGSPTGFVYDYTTNPATNIGTAVLGYNQSATTPIIEISAPLALLGQGSGTCLGTIPMVVYYDGGDTNPDDNLPGSGTVAINCGNPTAVNLQTFSADNNTSTLPLIGISLLAVLALVSAGVFIARREQTNA